MFYGGWDGTDTPFDQINSVTTADFLSFDNRGHVIANGDFLNVNNVNVQQLPDGSLHMICTGGQPGNAGGDKPVYFSSPDGTTWNGTPQPYPAQLSDVISIQGYAGFSTGNFNGANVLLRDDQTWVLYFKDWTHLDSTYWATAISLPDFQFQGVAQTGKTFVNDAKKITVSGQNWYLMGFVEIDPKQPVTYSLSKDGRSFPTEQILFNNISGQDLYIVAVGFVLKGNQLLGALYGASAVETLDQNQIVARWLVAEEGCYYRFRKRAAFAARRLWTRSPAIPDTPVRRDHRNAKCVPRGWCYSPGERPGQRQRRQGVSVGIGHQIAFL